LNALVIPTFIFLTVLASVGFGVLAAYAAVTGILGILGQQPRPQLVSRPRAAAPVLVPSQTHASGD